MKVIPLSLAENYIPTWGLKEAIRELIQNGIDQSTTNPATEFYIEPITSEESEYVDLIITTTNSKLSINTLLLGGGTKVDCERTIGKFGEGYKLALLVLTRMGIECIIEVTGENGLPEIWTPSLEVVEGFTNKSLHISINQLTFNTNLSNFNGVNFIIKKLQKHQVSEILNETYLDSESKELNYDIIETKYGQILIPKTSKDKVSIYSADLFICNNKYLKYSYNFNPGAISLNRDRNMADSFDIKSATSKMWGGILSTEDKLKYKDLLKKLITDGSEDVEYLRFTYRQEKEELDLVKEVSVEIVSELKGSVPVSSQSELASIKSLNPRARTTILPNVTLNIIKNVTSDIPQVKLPVKKKIVEVTRKTPYSIIKQVLANHRVSISGNKELLEEFTYLLEESKRWKINPKIKRKTK